jgi:hypothetical protein
MGFAVVSFDETSEYHSGFLVFMRRGFLVGQWPGSASGRFQEALDHPALPWTTGGHTPWFAANTVAHDATDAAQSGSLAHSKTNWLQTVVTIIEPGAGSF